MELDEPLSLNGNRNFSPKIDGTTPFYVTGSYKTSPMGKDFVPFSKEEDVKSFIQEHNRKKIYSFDAITKELK